MSKGVGIDIVEFKRIRENMSDRFIKRILSDEELLIFDKITNEHRKVEFLAGRFAAKEAYTKVYKKFNASLNFVDVKVLHDQFGAPYIKSAYKNRDKVKVSISHSENYAIAICIKD